ncbi:MAG TPA: helix-turn-helix transcriptional regulator [Atribacteraceae bacterium]|nr:helix-turn-helix transcriptional regulator [Atribacteraceae bacterium]
MSELGAYLKELRKKGGLSLGDLARETGFSRSYIYYVEEGHKRANPNFLRKLAEFHQVDPEGLFIRASYLPGPLSDKAEERLRRVSRRYDTIFLDYLEELNADGRSELIQYLEFLHSKERYRTGDAGGPELPPGARDPEGGGPV